MSNKGTKLPSKYVSTFEDHLFITLKLILKDLTSIGKGLIIGYVYEIGC
jgi:hypothetical protein